MVAIVVLIEVILVLIGALIEVILVLIGVLIEVILVAYLPQCNPSAPHLCLKTGQDLSERDQND